LPPHANFSRAGNNPTPARAQGHLAQAPEPAAWDLETALQMVEIFPQLDLLASVAA